MKKVVANDEASTSELLRLRAQLTAIIGDLGDKQQAFVEKLALAVDLKGKYKTIILKGLQIYQGKFVIFLN